MMIFIALKVFPLRALSTALQALYNEKEMVAEREEKIRGIANTAQDAIIMMDHEGGISFWNTAAEKIFGYRGSEMLGKTLHAVLAPQRYYETYRKGFADFGETGKGSAVGKTLELTALRKGGEEFPIELSLSAIQIKSKWHAVGIIRDITDRKSAEMSLKKERDLSLALIESMPGIFYLIDSKAKFQRWNKNFEVVLGYSAEEISTRSPLDFVVAHDREIVNASTREVFTAGKATVEATLASKNNGEIPYQLTGVRIDIDGAPYLVGIGMDIAERKRLEDEREKLIDNLQKAIAQVKTLSGMLPICASCKKIRDDKGYWSGVETYITTHSGVLFSHGICPDCEIQAYEELKKMKNGNS